jgi:hypothetical protein
VRHVTEQQPETLAPVEVRLVSNVVRVEEHPPRSITTEQTPVGPVAPVRLVAERPQRVSVTVQAAGAAVFVGDAGVTPGTGYRVPDGATLTVEATAALYAITAPGTNATAYLLSQHRDG